MVASAGRVKDVKNVGQLGGIGAIRWSSSEEKLAREG